MRFPILFTLLVVAHGISVSQSAQPSDGALHKMVYHTENRGLVFIEPIGPGMTLFGLGKRYNVSLDSLLAANPDLQPDAVPLGFPLHIPLNTQAVVFAPPSDDIPAIPISYRVQPKETLYRISKGYLGVSPEQITALNPRSDEGLAIGQVLHLGWYLPGQNTANATFIGAGTESDTTMSFPIKDFSQEYIEEGHIMRDQKGLAVWRPGNMQSHYYVLHPTARVGSYMEVTNPMLKRTLSAKVAGNIPPGLYPANVGLVVSPSVAKALGVLDQQFFASWRYVE